MTTTTTTSSTLTTTTIEEILEEINEEYYSQDYHTKQDLIRKAAKKLEEQTDIPRNMIASTLVKNRVHLRFIKSNRIIYRALESDYKRDYESEKVAQVDDNNAIEEDSKRVRVIYDIPEIEQPLEENRFRDLKNKNLDLKYEVKALAEEVIHYKNLLDAGMDAGTIDKNKMCHEIAISSDMYGQLNEMMQKSPYGIIIIHDGFNATKIKSMKFRKPTIGVEN
jgi:hypothetical protein